MVTKEAVDYDDSANPRKGDPGERFVEDPVWDIAVEIACGVAKEESRNTEFPDFDEVWDRMVAENAALPAGTVVEIPAE